MSTQQRIALITGASRGLGRNAAIRLADAGTDVVITYRSNRQEAEKVVGDTRECGRIGAALTLDVGKVATFDACVEQLRETLARNWASGMFDCLMNNASTGLHAPFAETTEEQFDEMVNFHLK